MPPKRRDGSAPVRTGRDGRAGGRRASAVGRWLRRAIIGGAVLFLALPLLLTLVFRFLPPPLTPLMLLRLAQGYPMQMDWRPLSAISPELRRSVIASEDAKFCSHWGFDWDAIDNALDRYEDGGRHILGASTISMQTAKNLYLWPGRNFLRKGAEAYLTLFLEGLWPKNRILEVYLNIIEFGPGLYGAEAASRHYFGKPAMALSAREAALLTAILPAPLERSPARPSAYVARRAAIIDHRADQVRLGPGGGCR